MQLNNLFIIPISYQFTDPLGYPEPHQLSPCKSLSKTNSQRDDITWKKSLSAFKKFKGKKDKETKSIKNSLSQIPFLQQNDKDQHLIKNFCLVENDINFSLLNSPEDETCKLEQTFDYFDPNHAPFFQFGVSYQYVPKQGQVHIIQEQQEHFEHLIQLKKTQSAKVKKQVVKKEKIKQQNLQRDNFAKTQKNCNSEGVLPQQNDLYEDPFIIIKAKQKRGEVFDSISWKTQNEKKQENKKQKMIKKNFKKVSNSSVYSRSSYSNQNSDELIKEESNSQSDEKSNDYGNNELPIIEFDLFKHINPVMNQVDKEQNGLDQLPIYELKENSQVMSRLKPYQNSTEILQQYDFNEDQMAHQNEH